MLVTPNICVVLHLDCNLHCKYCIRKDNPIPHIKPTKEFIEYLKSDNYRRIVFSGGEPLMSMSLIEELVSYIPKRVIKVITTNGTLLNSNIIDFVNKHKIELSISHDGTACEFHRGVDVLLNRRILSNIENIDKLTFKCLISSHNTDVVVNYEYIDNLVKHRPFFFNVCFLNTTKQSEHLLVDFDYRLFFESMHKLSQVSLNNAFILQNRILVQGMTTPDGNIYDMGGNKLGDVYTSTNQSIRDMELVYAPKCRYCKNRPSCYLYKSITTPHMCRSLRGLYNRNIYRKITYA